MSDKKALEKALDEFRKAVTEKVQTVKEAVENTRRVRQEQEAEQHRS